MKPGVGNRDSAKLLHNAGRHGNKRRVIMRPRMWRAINMGGIGVIPAQWRPEEDLHAKRIIREIS